MGTGNSCVDMDSNKYPHELKSKHFNYILCINEKTLILKNNLFVPQFHQAVYMLFEKNDKTRDYSYLLLIEGELYGKISSMKIPKEILVGLRSKHDKNLIITEFLNKQYKNCYDILVSNIPEIADGYKSCGDIYF